MSDPIAGPSPPQGFTRRRFLKRAAGLAALAASASLLPPNVRRAIAASAAAPPPKLASLREIRHVVLLLQENRSFDHYFGTLSGVRGFDDPRALRLSTGRSVFHQPDPDNPLGFLLPFHLDTRTTDAQRIPTTSHWWRVQHASWNDGRMDGWVTAHLKANGARGRYCMGYYERPDIPFHFALADAFTVCDAYHSSVLGPTWPNRMYWMTGTIDPEGPGVGPLLENREPRGGFTWTTYAERLEQAGIPWNVYRSKGGLGLSMLHRFRAFREAAGDSPLRAHGGLVAAPHGQFEDDAIHDRLPAVSWIIPPFRESEHPDFMPAAGAAFIASKLDAVAANPDVWAKTAFILAYDENDGLFDHVPPPVPPAGTPLEFLRGAPIGAGFRVPCIVISPWTVGGWVCSEPFDHTSVLQFLERFTGVKESNITPWRRRTFGDLTSAFRFDQPEHAPPTLPGTADELAFAKYGAKHLPLPPIPGADQQVPDQESGTRPHVPRRRDRAGNNDA